MLDRDATVFTYCFSRTVLGILKKAHNNGHKIQVLLPETRPNCTGQLMAKELLEAGIPVIFFADILSYEQMRKADLFLFGVDFMAPDGRILNKAGTATLVQLARQLKVPTFACTSPKKTVSLEAFLAAQKLVRPSSELWPDAPDSPNLTLLSPAYDLLDGVEIW
jgi:translation initiation factor 2B subunit (eIF-2B alpha/beta/delta family)